MQIKYKYSFGKAENLLLLIVIFFIQVSVFPQDDIRKKIAQMVVVGFDGASATDTLLKDLSQRNLGGVILMGANIVSPSQLKTLTQQIIKSASTIPFIATDQEGGKVARLSGSNGYEDTYTAFQLGTQFNSEDSTRKYSAKMALWLSDAGINMNFAPVVDVNVNPTSPAIGKYQRSFSALPYLVSKHAGFFIDEMHRKFLLTSIKHFPGHGSALQDSHKGFTDITATWTDLELIPYKNLISSGYNDIVMAGHLYNAKLDTSYPATLSNSIITGLLRNQLGYKGVVITDDMMMKGVTSNYSFENAIELSINAGCDILLYVGGIRNGSSILSQITDVVVNKVNEGKISSARIDESYSRIMILKNRLLHPSYVENKAKELKPVSGYSLEAYPNPFNPNTNIVCKINRQTFVSIKVYNITGQVVATLVNNVLSVGEYKFNFNGTSHSSGIYLVRMETPEGAVSRKIALLK